MAIYATTLTSPTIVGAHSGYVAQIKTGDFPALALTGANKIANGGGNVQIYTDSSKTTRLPIEIVECVTGVSPSILIYCRLPSVATGSTLYVVADDVQTTQPLPSAPFGSEAVWQDTVIRAHLNESANTTAGGYADSAGNFNGTGVSMSLANATNPYGDDVANFDNSPDEIVFTVNSMPTAITVSFWCKVNALNEDQRAVSFFNPSGANTNEQQTGVVWMDTGAGGDGWAAVRYNGSGGAEAIGVNNTDATTDWQFISATITQSDIEVYVDGVSTASSSVLTSSNIDDTTEIIIGRIWDLTGNSAYLNGALGGITVYSSDKRSFVATEHDNQSSTTWFTNDGWNTEGGGGFALDIDGGTYSSTGSVLSLLHNRLLSVDGGAYSIIGANINLLHNRVLNIDGGAYSYTGSAIDLIYNPIGGYQLDIDGGDYVSTGGDVDLLLNRAMQADGGNYSIIGANVATLYNRAFNIGGGSFSYSGASISLLLNRALQTDGGVYSTIGANVGLVYSGQITLLIDCYSVQFKQDEVTIDYQQDSVGIDYGCL